jgi:hypothetical protein
MRLVAAIVLERKAPLDDGLFFVEQRADRRLLTGVEATGPSEARWPSRFLRIVDPGLLRAEHARPAHEAPGPFGERSQRFRHREEYRCRRPLTGADLDVDPEYESQLYCVRRPREHRVRPGPPWIEQESALKRRWFANQGNICDPVRVGDRHQRFPLSGLREWMGAHHRLEMATENHLAGVRVEHEEVVRIVLLQRFDAVAVVADELPHRGRGA